MTEEDQDERPEALVPMDINQLLRLALIGAVIGLFTWGLTLLLDSYVFKAILCHGNASKCSASLMYANASGSILAAGIGLFALTKLQVFRALLVVIGVTLALWGFQLALLGTQSWLVSAIASIVGFSVSYAIFAWLARVRLFVIALLLFVILIVILRLLLNS